LRRQRQLAAGHEVQLARLAPDLQDDNPQCIASQRVGRGSQCAVHIRCPYGHDKTRVETELGQSAHRHRARFNFGEILPHPHQRSSCGRPPGEPGDETRCGSALPAGFGEHLVDCTEREPSVQRCVCVGMPEPHPSS
jgi:hypothetical protein